MSIPSQDNAARTGVFARAAIYTLLILFAVYYLLPLYVMLVNSLKPLEEIRQGQMLALPGEWGLFGFGDVGRVWLDGESSDKWHTSWGGGIWIGILARTNSVAFTIAQSDERTAFYVRAGFSF